MSRKPVRPTRQPNIHGALAAVMARRPFVGRDQNAEFRLGEPERHGTAERPFAAHRTALAGDDQNMPQAAVPGAQQEIQQKVVRLVLIKPVKIEPRLDR